MEALWGICRRQKPKLVPKVALDGSVGTNPERAEQRLVPVAAGGAISFAVGLGHVLRGIERSLESLGQQINIGLDLREVRLNPRLFVFDPVLLRLQQILWQSVCVKGLEQLLALAVEDLKASTKAADFLGVLFLDPGERFGKAVPHVLQVQVPVRFDCPDAELEDFDGRVLGGHPILDLMHGDVGQFAAGAFDAPKASEVVVDAAGFAPALHEGDALTAKVATQTSLQVVMVLAVPLAGHCVGVEDVLDTIESEPVDQWFMPTVWILSAAVADGADVVGVRQDAGEVASRKGACGLLGRASGSETSPLEGSTQRVEGVSAGGVGGKRPADMRCAVGVSLDRGDVSAGGLVALLHVEVSDGSRSRRPAEFGLLVEAALHVLGQGFGVELGVSGGVATHPFAERRVVEALHRRDDFDTTLF